MKHRYDDELRDVYEERTRVHDMSCWEHMLYVSMQVGNGEPGVDPEDDPRIGFLRDGRLSWR